MQLFLGNDKKSHAFQPRGTNPFLNTISMSYSNSIKEICLNLVNFQKKKPENRIKQMFVKNSSEFEQSHH